MDSYFLFKWLAKSVKKKNSQETSMNNSDGTAIRTMSSWSSSTKNNQLCNDEVNQSFCTSGDKKGMLLTNETHQGEGPSTITFISTIYEYNNLYHNGPLAIGKSNFSKETIRAHWSYLVKSQLMVINWWQMFMKDDMTLSFEILLDA